MSNSPNVLQERKIKMKNNKVKNKEPNYETLYDSSGKRIKLHNIWGKITIR